MIQLLFYIIIPNFIEIPASGYKGPTVKRPPRFPLKPWPIALAWKRRNDSAQVFIQEHAEQDQM